MWTVERLSIEVGGGTETEVGRYRGGGSAPFRLLYFKRVRSEWAEHSVGR